MTSNFNNLQEKYETKEKKFKEEILSKKSELDKLKYDFQQEKVRLTYEKSNQRDDLLREK